MFFKRSKFREQFLKRVTQGTILWNYSKFWQMVSEMKIFYEFLYVHIVQKVPPPPPPPPPSCHVFWQIKILQTIFEKGRPRYIPVNFFQNQGKGFREEDLLRISSCPYCVKSLRPMAAMFLMDQNFTNTFWKGSHKEQSCEIISKLDQRFQRRFL